MFCDAASGFIHVEHQVTFTAAEPHKPRQILNAPLPNMGSPSRATHRQRRLLVTRLMAKVAKHGQSIGFSGVGAEWQNDTAKNSIETMATKARTMMIHASLHWPDECQECLWPMAVSCGAHLHNHIPNRESGISPAEDFSDTVANCEVLHNAHVWGCPVCVLQPKLSDASGKLPKWQPRSRHVQFVGISPLHSEEICIVHNLRTGCLSPQSHVVADELFETVSGSASDDSPPPTWEDLNVFQRCETVGL